MAKSENKKRITESNKIIIGVVEVSDNVRNASEKLKDTAISKTIDVNGEKTSYVAASLVSKNVDEDLRKIIKNTNSSFSDFVEATHRYLSDNYAISLTKRDLAFISDKGSDIMDDLVTNTKILKRDIQNLLTQNLAKGVPDKILVNQLKDLYPAYARNASTLINTGMSRLFTDINVSKFKDQDFNWYIWAGPDDKLTRELPCKHWVWHRFPASQLPSITATRMRLFNCRHSIIPIDDDTIKQYKIGDLQYA